MSDLHLTRGHYELPELECDVVINAGDTHHSDWARDYVREYYETAGVQYASVMGNHDFYTGRFPRPGEGQFATQVGDLLVAGATLWTETTPSTFELCRRNLTDSSYIDGYTYDAMRECHEADLAFLRESGADVVVTHHAPFCRSVTPAFEGYPCNHCFVSDLEEAFSRWEKRPRLWVHGHVHSRHDYRVGDTRVVCWPRGYPFEETYAGYAPVVLCV